MRKWVPKVQFLGTFTYIMIGGLVQAYLMLKKYRKFP